MEEQTGLLVQVHIQEGENRVCVDGWRQPSYHPTPLIGDIVLSKFGNEAVQRRVVSRVWDRRLPGLIELSLDTVEVKRWTE